MTPAFDPAVTDYSVTTSNATNTVTAAAFDNSAEVSIILNGSTTVTSGTAVTWADGQNDLAITVVNGGVAKTYDVTVIKK